MLHRLQCERGGETRAGTEGELRRFVLHRHRDGGGAHLDLRLEQDGYLMGYRIDGPTLEGTRWATVKAPHPTTWLTQDGEAVREDEGTYFWDSGGGHEGVLVLCGARDTVCIWVDPVDDVSAGDVAALRAAAETMGLGLGDLVALAEDGKTARDRAVARYCGLGRELDGESFDDGLWRRTLAGERLGVVQQYLHGLELRFDRKYPPLPVSQPVALEEEACGGEDSLRALSILRK